jgi:branched-subunit amino acid ABC-type transport system permease component
VVVNWAQILFNSAITGSLYLIGAVGLTLTYGLSRFPNFAHAEFITLGAFIGYFVADQIGLGLPLALIVAFLCTGVVGILCYRGIFQPLAKGGAGTITFDEGGDRVSGTFEIWKVVKDATTATGYKNVQIKLVNME